MAWMRNDGSRSRTAILRPWMAGRTGSSTLYLRYPHLTVLGVRELVEKELAALRKVGKARVK